MEINDFFDRPEFRELKREMFRKENTDSLEELLSKPYYEEAAKILVKEMGINAGYELLNQMKEVFGNEKKVLSWFYTPSIALGRRPYDYCKIGKRQAISAEVTRIEHGLLA